ncbi:hypothetical protein ACLOJK_005312 [Asimina triloba]
MEHHTWCSDGAHERDAHAIPVHCRSTEIRCSIIFPQNPSPRDPATVSYNEAARPDPGGCDEGGLPLPRLRTVKASKTHFLQGRRTAATDGDDHGEAATSQAGSNFPEPHRTADAHPAATARAEGAARQMAAWGSERRRPQVTWWLRADRGKQQVAAAASNKPAMTRQWPTHQIRQPRSGSSPQPPVFNDILQWHDMNRGNFCL